MSSPQQMQALLHAVDGLHLYDQDASATTTKPLGWQIAPEPFTLTPQQLSQIKRLGPLLWRYVQAIEQLYQQSLKGQSLGWVADYCHLGKPDTLLQFARNKRFKKSFPTVLRPDLLITETGFALTELDSIPGGLGFIGALNTAYRQAGFGVLETPNGLIRDFVVMLQAQLPPDRQDAAMAVLLSDEAADYRLEWTWLVNTARTQGANLYLAHPNDIQLMGETVVLQQEGKQTPIALMYRFFELFDLPNIPKLPLLQYAVQKGWVVCTPGFRPHLEEKLWLALLHHPALQMEWLKLLGEADLAELQAIVPPGWIIDPRPVPPSAQIPGLKTARGNPMTNFSQLSELSQKQRELVLKPSGFSPLAWGSRGVTIGHDVSQTEWQAAVNDALNHFEQGPYILQHFEKPKAHAYKVWLSDQEQSRQGRTRLCPYYLVKGDRVELVSVLATTCPADKKIIHGMSDAVLAPCFAPGFE